MQPELAGTPPRNAALAIAFLTTLAVVISFLLGQIVQAANLPLGLAWSSLFVFGAAGISFALLFNLRLREVVGLRRPSGTHLVLAGLAAIANVPLANWLMGVCTELLPHEWSELARRTTRLLAGAEGDVLVLIAIAAAIAAPIGEELFFRGWLQPVLGGAFRPVGAILGTAIVFSAIHGDPVGFLPRIELGVLFGLARWWTGSLWPAVLFHALHNGTSILALFIVEEPLLELDKPYEIVAMLPIAVAGLVGLVVLMALLHRTRVEPSPLLARDPERPPLAPMPRATLPFVVPAGIVALTSAALILVFHASLPGADLTQFSRILRQLLNAS